MLWEQISMQSNSTTIYFHENIYNNAKLFYATQMSSPSPINHQNVNPFKEQQKNNIDFHNGVFVEVEHKCGCGSVPIQYKNISNICQAKERHAALNK